MYFVVVGGGKIGVELVRLLLGDDNEVLLIEKKKEKCDVVSDEFGIIVINDDATKEGVLEQANIKEADAIVVLTDSDEINLIIGMIAKSKGAKMVAIKLTKTSYNKEILDKMGIDLAIHPEAAAASYIEEFLLKPAVIDLASLNTGNAEIQEILVTKDSPFFKKKVKDLSTDKSRLIAIYETNNIKYPKEDYILKENDKILVLVNKSKS